MKLINEKNFLANIKELCDGDIAKATMWTGKGIEMVLSKHLKDLPEHELGEGGYAEGYNQYRKDCEDK